jgi:hypothetical protein
VRRNDVGICVFEPFICFFVGRNRTVTICLSLLFVSMIPCFFDFGSIFVQYLKPF